MPHFKDSEGNLFWLDETDPVEVWGKPDWMEITDEEAEAMRQPPVPDYSSLRAEAYRVESDPLFFKAQRGEATMDEWKAKVAEIKARWPQ